MRTRRTRKTGRGDAVAFLKDMRGGIPASGAKRMAALPHELVALIGEYAGWPCILFRLCPCLDIGPEGRLVVPRAVPQAELNEFAADLAAAGDLAGLSALWGAPVRPPNPDAVLITGAMRDSVAVMKFACVHGAPKTPTR